MTDAELFLVDYALQHIAVGLPFRIRGALYNAQIGIQDKYPKETYDEIVRLVLYQDQTIRNLLLEEEYTRCIDPPTQQDILSDKGKIAKQKGGHRQYIEWEQAEKRRKDIEEWPKRHPFIFEPLKSVTNWIIGAILAAIFGAGGYLIGRHSVLRNIQVSQPQVQRTKAVQPSSKISNEKDTTLKRP